MYFPNNTGKKSLRRSTQAKSQAVEKREKERVVQVKMMKEMAAKKNVPEVRRLTQEELLAEAKITEQINIQQLGKYGPSDVYTIVKENFASF